MGVTEMKGENVCLELKNGNKYFGILWDVDDTPKHFSWISLKLKTGYIQLFADSEIIRLEVLG